MDTREPGRTRLSAVAISTLALSLGSVLPATAAPSTYTYDALGDSYAAGYGVAPGGAYPYVLDGRMRIALDDLAAVPTGGTIEHLITNQLAVLDAETDLVTISIGGNDIPWIQVVLACALSDLDTENPTEPCNFWLTQAGTAIEAPTALPAGLAAAYAGVAFAAPNAHVVVTGYPRLFSPEYGDYAGRAGDIPFDISVAEQEEMNVLADKLNGAIATAAAAQHFQFVDVTSRFDGHGVNSPEAYVFGVTDPVPLHPNVDGQHEYGVALRSSINPNDLR